MDHESYNLQKMSDDEELKEDLIELQTNRALEMQFESKTLEEFWCSALGTGDFPPGNFPPGNFPPTFPPPENSPPGHFPPGHFPPVSLD